MRNGLNGLHSEYWDIVVKSENMIPLLYPHLVDTVRSLDNIVVLIFMLIMIDIVNVN